MHLTNNNMKTITIKVTQEELEIFANANGFLNQNFEGDNKDMKTITIEQINAVLQAIYQTNIPVAQFDAIKKMFADLPEVKEEPKKK
jgi:hypothetical protein